MNMRKIIKIKGMTCGHCSARVEKMLLNVDGINDAVVDLAGENAIIKLEKEVADDVIREAVDDAGYEVIDIQSQ